MRELPITTCDVRMEGPRRLTLRYMILVEETPAGVERYGVKITESESGDTAMARDLTISVPKIYALIEMLADNTVTPTGLMDVLADLL